MVVANRSIAITEFLAEFDKFGCLNQASIVCDRSQYFKFPPAINEDYCERVFTIGSDGHVLAGIRFAGGNPEKRFVGIWPDNATSTQSAISGLRFAKSKRYAPTPWRLFSGRTAI